MVKILLTVLALCVTFILGANSFYEKPNAPWGIDADLLPQKKPMPTPSATPQSRVCQSMIRFFQVYISPIDGPRSSYIPSSSQYALLAIKKYGVLKGIALGCDRLLRENGEPWVYDTTDKYARLMKWDPVN